MKLGAALTRLEKEQARVGIPPAARKHYGRALSHFRVGMRITAEHFAEQRRARRNGSTA